MTRLTLLVLALAACGDAAPAPTGYPDVVPPDTADATPDADTGDTAADVDAGPDVVAPAIHKVELEVDPAAWQDLQDHIDDPISVAAVVTVDGQRIADGTVEAHGGEARTFPKKSYRIDLPDEPDSYLDLFGDGPEKQRRFVLKASWIDRTFLREPLMMQLIRDGGGLAPRMSYTELWVNDHPLGLYQIMERIDRPYLARHDLEAHACHLYKAEDHNANWAWKAAAAAGYDVQLAPDDDDDGDADDAPVDTSDLAALLDACSHTATTDAAFAAAVEPRLSLDDELVWQRIHTFGGDRDAYTKNYYLYHDVAAAPDTPLDRFRIISWDSDAVFGIEWDGTDLPGDQADWYGSDAFAPRLFAVPTWRARYLAAYDAALGGPLAPAAIEAWLDAHAPLIADWARADLAAWQPERDWDGELARLKTLVGHRWTVMRAAVDALR